MNKTFTFFSIILMLFFTGAISAQEIFSDDFESGTADPNWEAFYPGEEIVTAVPMSSAPQPLPNGGNYVGWLQDADTSYTGIASSVNGETTMQDYSIEGDVYCYVNNSGGSAYTGLVVYADSSIGTYIKMAADFDQVPYPRIRLFNNHFDMGTYTYTFEHSFTADDIPGGIPTEDGWHHFRLDVRTLNADSTAFWCYFDGQMLLGSPVIDTSEDRMSSGQFGVFSFQMDDDGIPGFYDNIVVNSLVTAVEDNLRGNYVPENFSLEQNHPNPFNPETQISYQLSSDGFISLTVYNLLGREIKTLVSEYQPSGYYTVSWNGKDEAGNIMPSGVYMYTLRFGNIVQSKKMIMMK